jgi:hypothetical protein
MSRSTFSEVAMKVASPVSKRTCSPSNRMDSSCPAIQIVPVPSGSGRTKASTISGTTP